MSYKHERKILKETQKAQRQLRKKLKESRIARKYKIPEFKELDVSTLNTGKIVHLPEDNWIREAPSLDISAIPTAMPNQDVEPSEIMRERERRAREIADARKKMIAPLYNKGTYQYLGDAPREIIHGLGRKV